MTAALTRLVPRRKSDPVETMRTGPRVQADLDAVDREVQDATAEIGRLSAQTRAILLSGDDAAHEKHEAEIARLKRVQARAQARQEDLAAELAAALAREAEAAEDRRRAETKAKAEAAVAAVRSKFASAYTKPAETIAAFLAELSEAEALARDANILGPMLGTRQQPGRVIPPSRRPYEAYVREDGTPTQNPHPYKPDGLLDQTKTRELRTFYEDVPGRSEMGRHLPALVDLVRLPHLDQPGDHHSGNRLTFGNRWS